MRERTIFDSLAWMALLLGALLSTAGFVLAFTTAPMVKGVDLQVFAQIGGVHVDYQLLFSQKIFYFHMPVAITSFIALLFTAIYSIIFLVKKDPKYDLRARIATEIALVFVLMTMASGMLWERYEWGVWWTWEPRLTTYFILTLMVIAYFILRRALDDPERRATYAAVFGVIAAVNAPISFLITRIIPTRTHPVIFRTDSGLPPDMLLPLLLSMFGILMVAFGIYRFRLREQRLRLQLEDLKAQLED
ncbi:MAG: cytochrome c biogenesis protein CcsA [Coriobacteriales bacterium]|nr:cytochrome c biogenesis protein CcsA [Coriobacteriales bacterium]